MKQILLVFLITVIVFNCYAQYPDNKRPMYGEVEKSEEMKKLDEDFVKASITAAGSKDKAFEQMIKRSWAFLYHDSTILAMKRFNQSWLINPESPETYFGFGAILEFNKEYSEAERMFKIGISKTKSQVEIDNYFKKVADCLEKNKDTNGVISTFERIILVNPDNKYALQKLGFFYIQKSEYKKAMLNLNQALKLDSTDINTLFNRGYLNLMLKNFNLAITDFTKILNYDSLNIQALLYRADSYLENGNIELSIKDYEHCTKLKPESGEFRRVLGFWKLILKRNEEACKDFKLALELGDLQANECINTFCK